MPDTSNTPTRTREASRDIMTAMVPQLIIAAAIAAETSAALRWNDSAGAVRLAGLIDRIVKPLSPVDEARFRKACLPMLDDDNGEDRRLALRAYRDQARREASDLDGYMMVTPNAAVVPHPNGAWVQAMWFISDNVMRDEEEGQ